MNKIRKIIGCAALCMAVTAQTVFAEQMQVEFYGETTANKQISILALEKDLPDSEVKEQNIKYINQISADSDGGYSIKFPFETDGDEYVLRSNLSGEPDKSLEGGFDMDFLLHFGPSHYPELFRGETPYFSHSGGGNISDFFEYYMSCLKKTEGKGFICLPTGNHDMERISDKLDESEIKLAFAFIMSMPGIPFIYYGDEIGMHYIKGLTSVEGGFNRTGSRTPMQWDDSTNDGFSTAAPEKLYITMDKCDDRPTVKRQMNDKNSILNELKKLMRIRKSNQALQESAAFEPVFIKESAYPLVYKRVGEDESILVAINPTDKESVCLFDEDVGDAIYSFNGEALAKDSTLTVPPCSASYIRIV